MGSKDDWKQPTHKKFNTSKYKEAWDRLKKELGKYCWRCGKLNKTDSHKATCCKTPCKCTHCHKDSHIAKFCIRNRMKESGKAYAMEYDGASDQEGEEEEEAAHPARSDEWEDSDEDSEDEERNRAVHMAGANHQHTNDLLTMREHGTRFRETSAPYHSGNWRA